MCPTSTSGRWPRAWHAQAHTLTRRAPLYIQAMAPKESSKAKGKRPASAPPQRPQSSGGAAEQDAAAQSDEYNLSGELEARPSGGGYESEEEADRPPHIV